MNELQQRLSDWKEYREKTKIVRMFKDHVMDAPDLHNIFYFLFHSAAEREKMEQEAIQQLAEIRQMLAEYEKKYCQK